MERRATARVCPRGAVQTLGSMRYPDACSAIMTHSCATYAPLMRHPCAAGMRAGRPKEPENPRRCGLRMNAERPNEPESRTNPRRIRDHDEISAAATGRPMRTDAPAPSRGPGLAPARIPTVSWTSRREH
jgi:hypothetical protein